ncbi:hypothetical protein CA951_13560 [Rhodococcus sp. NCIMB 12038]|nr:hypothetical protein CA951_13560 [Rhodococcus sp. NCIMB 12038]
MDSSTPYPDNAPHPCRDTPCCDSGRADQPRPRTSTSRPGKAEEGIGNPAQVSISSALLATELLDTLTG